MRARVKLPEETNVALSMPLSMSDRSDLLTFIITNRSKKDLGYEFKYSKTANPVFLTGKEEGVNLPVFRYPVVSITNGITYIISNLSGTLKQDLADSLLKSKRTDYVDFETLRNMLVYYTVSAKDIDSIATYTAQLATMWIVKTLKNQLRLDIFSETELEGAVFNYFIRSYIAIINKDTLVTKMTNLLSGAYRGSIAKAGEMIDKLDSVPLDIGQYINAICTDHKILSTIETKNILSIISTHWYSGADASSLQVFMAIENLHTMTSIIMHAIETPTGKSTVLGRMIQDNRKMTKIEQLVASINAIRKEHTMY